ncbi:MAG: glycoside hydrolase family 127 protein [Anaerolineales bacterium]|nr:glycoside hydrolase family 127 protein [Anaerolineales bacterium]
MRRRRCKFRDGYAWIAQWRAGDAVELHLPLPVRRVESHAAVTENRGKVAIERGPLVCCLEGIDNDGRP